MFHVEVKYWDEWKVLYRFTVIEPAINCYMSLAGKGEVARIIYVEQRSILHAPIMQNK